MKYYVTPSAIKDLRRLEVAIQKHIIGKLDFFMRAADPLAFAKPLRDRRFGGYRFRVGEYRIIFDIRNGKDAVILAIGNRKDIYR